MLDNTIPGELRLSLYLSASYLQELKIALQLAGIDSRYTRPGIDGVTIPRLYVTHPRRHAELDRAICAIPRLLDGQSLEWDAPDPVWWLMWWHTVPLYSICQAVDMSVAARLIARQLEEAA